MDDIKYTKEDLIKNLIDLGRQCVPPLLDTSESALMLLLSKRAHTPQPGDLVIETTKFITD